MGSPPLERVPLIYRMQSSYHFLFAFKLISDPPDLAKTKHRLDFFGEFFFVQISQVNISVSLVRFADGPPWNDTSIHNGIHSWKLSFGMRLIALRIDGLMWRDSRG